MAAKDPKKPKLQWWYNCTKCHTVLGTTNTNAFHVSLLQQWDTTSNNDQSASDTKELNPLQSPKMITKDTEPTSNPSLDCLPIQLFSDLLPYYRIPMCGVYCQDDYKLTDPLVLILLPTTSDLISSLPSTLQDNIDKHLPDSLDDVLFAVIVHSRPLFHNGVDHPSKHLNILFHTWAFEESSEPEGDTTILTGVFQPQGASEVYTVDIPEELNGISFNRLSPKAQYMHNVYSLSPHNCHLKCMDGYSACSFFTVGVTDVPRLSIVYHIVPITEDCEGSLLETLAQVSTVGELFSYITETNSSTTSDVLHRLFESLK